MKQITDSKSLKIIYVFLVLVIILFSVWDTYYNKSSNTNENNYVASTNKMNSNNTTETKPNPTTSTNSKIQTESNLNSNTQSDNKAAGEKFTWTEYVIKPIVLNPMNQLIFKILFYLSCVS